MALAPLWSVWGRGDLGSFAGRPEPGMRYEGELRTGWLGMDARAGPWVAGFAVSHGTGEAEYSFTDGGVSGSGRLVTSLTALYPYGRWTLSDGLELRGVLGAGRGEARHRLDDGERETSDLSMWMGSAGLRHELPQFAGIDLAARGDASLARMETEHGPDHVDGLTADSWRLRAGLEASRRIALDGDEAVTPFVEAAARRDGGDGVEGTGLEVAGGLRYTAPLVQIEARGRWLASHTEEGAEERGVSVTARMGPGAHGRGLSLALSPRWGAGTGRAEALWRDELPDPAGAAGGDGRAHRLRHRHDAARASDTVRRDRAGGRGQPAAQAGGAVRCAAPASRRRACGRAPGGRRGRTGARGEARSRTAVLSGAAAGRHARMRRDIPDEASNETGRLPAMNSRLPLTAAFLAAALALGACGGGGGSGGPAPPGLSDSDDPRVARLGGLLERADALRMSGMHARWSLVALGEETIEDAFVDAVSCSGTRCVAADGTATTVRDLLEPARSPRGPRRSRPGRRSLRARDRFGRPAHRSAPRPCRSRRPRRTAPSRPPASGRPAEPTPQTAPRYCPARSSAPAAPPPPARAAPTASPPPCAHRVVAQPRMGQDRVRGPGPDRAAVCC